jgi:GNAT superfamily N-acetyltransferase
MGIEVVPVEVKEILPLRELYRKELNCQIVHDRWLERGFSDAYLLRVDGATAAYGAVRNDRHDKGLLHEFYTLPEYRAAALPIFRQLLSASNATKIRAQTNDPLMLLMLYDSAQEIESDTILFHDAVRTQLTCPDGLFRKVAEGDAERIFKHHHEPAGDWMIECDGAVAATGGAFFHYNPPYGDIYMEVHEPYRRRGFGSYLVQEVKRVCYEMGKVPAARTGVSNVASRKTLEKAGLLPCARVLDGSVVM